MCLAVPVQIVELLPNTEARIVIDGVKSVISTALIDAPQIGEYVIVHTGVALCRLSVEEAERTLAYFAALAAAQT